MIEDCEKEKEKVNCCLVEEEEEEEEGCCGWEGRETRIEDRRGRVDDISSPPRSDGDGGGGGDESARGGILISEFDSGEDEDEDSDDGEREWVHGKTSLGGGFCMMSGQSGCGVARSKSIILILCDDGDDKGCGADGWSSGVYQ